MPTILPTEAEINFDLSSIAAHGPLPYCQGILREPLLAAAESKRAMVVVLPLHSKVTPDLSGLAVLLSLARWAKARNFSRPVHFVVREGDIPTAEENNAESILMLGSLGRLDDEVRKQTYESYLPTWFSRRADYVAFLSNDRARDLTNVAVSLFSDACSLNIACVKPSKPSRSLFPAFNSELGSPVPTVLVTDTAPHRQFATLNVKRLSEIVGGLEAIIEGVAGEASSAIG